VGGRDGTALEYKWVSPMNPSSITNPSHIGQPRQSQPRRDLLRPEACVAASARVTVVRVPAWFTVAQALRVAELKGADRLLLEGRASGVVSRIVLEHAPANDMVLRWAHRGIPSIDAGTKI